MLFTSTRYSTVIVYNSITNTLNDEKFDSVKPFTFLEYLNYTKALDKSVLEFSDYQKYLEGWNAVTTKSYTDINTQVKEQFVQFLKTITLNYTTNEEKRFLSNIDFNNPNDLEIAAPFYTAKIKQVLLYFAEKRDTYKIDLQLAKNKGTVDGVESYLKTYIIETIFGNDNPTFTNLQTPLSTISTQIQIEVEEGYDNFNDYFDLDPFKQPSFYNADGDRKSYFSSNTNTSDYNLFLDYDQAIINLINSEQVVCDALQTLVFNINEPNLDLLQTYDFIDYTNRTRSNTILILQAELIKKFTGTNFSYLSTNSLGQVVSGGLFEATSPYSNLLNLNSPSTLTVPISTTLYEREAGLFFKPSQRGIIQLDTPFSYYLKDDIKPDHVYIFPDPDSYGNVSGVSKVDHETPLTYKMEGEKIQKNISSNNALGNTNVTDKDFTFESYHSQEQLQKFDGFATSLYNAGVVSQYFSDVFGNTFIGLKQSQSNYINNLANNLNVNISQLGLSAFTNTLYLSSIEKLLTGTLSGTQTITDVASSVPTSNPSIYSTRNSVGNFYVYNIATDTLGPISSQFNNVFLKYPSQYNELVNSLVSVEVYNNTYVFTTSSYTIVDKVVYKNNSFNKSSNIPLILTHGLNNEISNSFLVDNTLYFAKYVLNTTSAVSAYNSRIFELKMYSYDVDAFKYTQYTALSSSYDVNTKLDAYNVKLSYNKKQDIFNVAIDVKDTNKNYFLNVVQLRFKSGNVNLLNNKLFYPTNGNLTINIYDSSNITSLLYNALATTPNLDPTNGTITF